MQITAGIYLFAAFFLLAFLADLVPFFRGMGRIAASSQSSLQTIRSTGLSDDEKQKILLANSGKMFLESMKIVGLTLLLIAILFGLLHLAELIKLIPHDYLMGYMISTQGIIISVISFSMYFLAKGLYGRIRI